MCAPTYICSRHTTRNRFGEKQHGAPKAIVYGGRHRRAHTKLPRRRLQRATPRRLCVHRGGRWGQQRSSASLLRHLQLVLVLGEGWDALLETLALADVGHHVDHFVVLEGRRVHNLPVVEDHLGEGLASGVLAQEAGEAKRQVATFSELRHGDQRTLCRDAIIHNIKDATHSTPTVWKVLGRLPSFGLCEASAPALGRDTLHCDDGLREVRARSRET